MPGVSTGLQKLVVYTETQVQRSRECVVCLQTDIAILTPTLSAVDHLYPVTIFFAVGAYRGWPPYSEGAEGLGSALLT